MRFKGVVTFVKKVNTDKASQEGLKKGILTTALNIKSQAKLLAPVREGQLRNSIDIEADQSGLNIKVGSGLEYAPYQEFGTRNMAAQPFLRPAVEIVRGRSIEEVKAELNIAMESK